MCTHDSYWPPPVSLKAIRSWVVVCFTNPLSQVFLEIKGLRLLNTDSKSKPSGSTKCAWGLEFFPYCY